MLAMFPIGLKVRSTRRSHLRDACLAYALLRGRIPFNSAAIKKTSKSTESRKILKT
jgi:hypothetical protein